MRAKRWRELLRRLRYRSPTAREYCRHTCVLCGIEISHYRLECAEAEIIYAPHVDCRVDLSSNPIRPWLVETSGHRQDAHLGAVEEGE